MGKIAFRSFHQSPFHPRFDFTVRKRGFLTHSFFAFDLKCRSFVLRVWGRNHLSLHNQMDSCQGRNRPVTWGSFTVPLHWPPMEFRLDFPAFFNFFLEGEIGREKGVEDWVTQFGRIISTCDLRFIEILLVWPQGILYYVQTETSVTISKAVHEWLISTKVDIPCESFFSLVFANYSRKSVLAKNLCGLCFLFFKTTKREQFRFYHLLHISF